MPPPVKSYNTAADEDLFPESESESVSESESESVSESESESEREPESDPCPADLVSPPGCEPCSSFFVCCCITARGLPPI